MAWIHVAIFWFSLMSISAYRYVDSYGYLGHQRRLLSEPSRMSERSIQHSDQNQSLHSRSSTRAGETARSENGTFKILNKQLGYNRRHDSPTKDDIVFPGLSSRSSNPYIPDVPESCKELGICSEVPNYPKEEVDALVAQVKGSVEFQYDKLTSLTPDIAQRTGAIDQSFPLCKSREEILHPEAGESYDKNWYIIINSKDNPVQGFKVEICDKSVLVKGSGCASFVTFENSYNAKCIQKFMYRKMKVMSQDGKGIIDKLIKIPTCCSCVATLLPDDKKWS